LFSFFSHLVAKSAEKYEPAQRNRPLPGGWGAFFGSPFASFQPVRPAASGRKTDWILVGMSVAIEFNTGCSGLRIHWTKDKLRRIVMLSWFHRTAAVVLASLILASGAFAADTGAQPSAKPHRLLIQIDQNDPAVMNLALNNATNVIEYYRSKGKEVAVDIVTYGPGLHMLRSDTSPVQDRIKQLKSLAFPSTIQFSACNVTRQGMENKEGHPIDILSDAIVVPSGVIHLMELQEDGWSYIRP
jgi:uncharacterized protein